MLLSLAGAAARSRPNRTLLQELKVAEFSFIARVFLPELLAFNALR